MNRIPIVVGLLLLFVLAACASDAASPTPTTTPTAEPTPEATSAEPGPTDDGEPTETDVAIPSFDLDGDPELASRLPDTVDGQPLQVISMRGDMFLSGGDVDPSFQEFLDNVGADLDDVSVAFGGVASGESFLSVAAFRILGVSEDRLEEEFLGASEEAGDLTGLERTTIAGKEVWAASDPSGELGGASIYIYTKDDTLYWMTGNEEQAAEILEALP